MENVHKLENNEKYTKKTKQSVLTLLPYTTLATLILCIYNTVQLSLVQKEISSISFQQDNSEVINAIEKNASGIEGSIDDAKSDIEGSIDDAKSDIERTIRIWSN